MSAPATPDVTVDADRIGAGAETLDGPGRVVALRTLDDGATVASMVESDAGTVWSLQDCRTAADLAPDGPAWWEQLR